MAKKKQNRTKGKAQQRRQRQRNIRERAVNDIQLMDQPQVDLQNALLQQAQEDYLRELQTARSTFGGAEDAIRGIEGPDFGGIAEQLQGWMNGLAPEFGGGGYMGFSPEEAAAGQGYGGALAGASLGNIASDIARSDAAQAGAQREAVVGGRNVEDSVIQRMEDTMQQYRNTLQNIRADDPWQIKSRTDELTDQSFEQRALREKMANDRAFSEWMQNYLGGQIGGGGGGGFGGGGGGGGNRPRNAPGVRPSGGQDMPGQGTVSHASIDNQGMSPSVENRYPRNAIRNIRQADDFGDIPPWLQNVYENATGHNRWAMVKNNPRRAQIFRQTRGAVRPLYRENESFGNPGWENPFQWGG